MSNGPSAAVSGRAAVNSVVVLMLENRSSDHMPGFLYPGSTSPSGQPFDGLTGTESNPGSDGKPVTVSRSSRARPAPATCLAPAPARAGPAQRHPSVYLLGRVRQTCWLDELGGERLADAVGQCEAVEVREQAFLR
jgi:hypothetical protein